MKDFYKLPKPVGPLDAVVRIPGSKSLTNRALVLASLSRGTSILSNALLAEDIEVMLDALVELGFAVSTDRASQRIEVTGCSGHVPATDATLFCGNSGTTARFVAALSSLGMGRFEFDGVPRMRQRPIGPLMHALRRLGVGVEYLGDEGFLPLAIHADRLGSGEISIDGSQSSQFVSALLMVAPCANGDVMIEVTGGMVSVPYVRMTLRLMEQFGVSVVDEIGECDAKFVVPAPQAYRAVNYAVEPDASNASYFLAAASLAGGNVVVEGLGTDSVQGDARFVDVLEAMGCSVERGPDFLKVSAEPGGRLRAVDVDLNDMPDMAQTVAVLALFADRPSRIRNVANLRIKETDRLVALMTELSRLGADVRELDDGLVIQPPTTLKPSAIETYADHRMAMSFALVGLRVPGVTIRDPGCVGKTFPDFFDRWEAMCGSIRPC